MASPPSYDSIFDSNAYYYYHPQDDYYNQPPPPPPPPLHAPSPVLHQPSSALLTASVESYYPTQSCQPTSPSYATYPYDSTSYSSIPTPSQMLGRAIQDNNPPYSYTPASPPQEHKNDTSRKALRRAITTHIGFPPTDIENITSHEKKRQYLECLEYYVSFLHQQITLVGAQPVKMKKVRPVQGRGMSSKSIRTLLVHMAKVNEKLHQKTLTGEQQFVCLRDTANQQSDLAPSVVQSETNTTGLFKS